MVSPWVTERIPLVVGGAVVVVTLPTKMPEFAGVSVRAIV